MGTSPLDIPRDTRIGKIERVPPAAPARSRLAAHPREGAGGDGTDQAASPVVPDDRTDVILDLALPENIS